MPERSRRPRLLQLYPPCKSGGYRLVHHEFCTTPVPTGWGAPLEPKGSQFLGLERRTHRPNRSGAAPARGHERRRSRG